MRRISFYARTSIVKRLDKCRYPKFCPTREIASQACPGYMKSLVKIFDLSRYMYREFLRWKSRNLPDSATSLHQCFPGGACCIADWGNCSQTSNGNSSHDS